ncbi:MAG: hypothetical protein P1S46_03570 [bacterium]|nr:hypothetical protein [bacterium]MDT8395787.1 hypothetical protein [bacterium]
MKIKNLEDVLRQLPIKGEVAFAGGLRGKFTEKAKKQQLKVLRDFVDDLKHVLEPGEEILLASRGASPFTMVEQLTTGAWIYHIKRCLLVLTDRRLLHFPADYRYKPRMAAAQVRFNDIDSFKGKKRITFRYKNGTKEAFSQVRHGKRLVGLLKGMVGTISTSTQHGGRQHLCPRCVAPLARERYTCPRCRLEFKEPGAARLYSIFLPGGGYFYTRHPWLGVGDAITELTLMFFTFVFLLEYFTTEASSVETLYLGLFFGVILVVEKLITIYHARHFIKEYIPMEKRFNRIPQTVEARTPVVREQNDLYEDEKVTFK